MMGLKLTWQALQYEPNSVDHEFAVVTTFLVEFTASITHILQRRATEVAATN
jgi:hypothetical protein